MTALEWFRAYEDAVDVSRLLLMCRNNTTAERLYTRTLAAYTATRGRAHVEEMARQVSLLLAGVQALRGEAA